MKKYLIILCASLLPSISLSEGLPDLGDISQTVITPIQERQIGRSSLLQIRASEQYLGDVEVNDYLQQIGNRLVEHSDEAATEFEFFAINDKGINAFALPGGFVGVNTGLLLLSESESELAAVLSHEIAHVTQHHIARIISEQKNNSLISIASLAVAILAARSNPEISQAAIAGSQAHSIQKQIDFTRTHEQEADRIGLNILQKADFNQHAMPSFLNRMQRVTRVQETNLPDYLRTHPITNERVSDIEHRVNEAPYKLLADSIGFQLVQAKLRVKQQGRESISYFENALKNQFGNPVVQRYGLIYALLENRTPNLAAEQLKLLRLQVDDNPLLQHPMLETQEGLVKQATEKQADVLKFYQHELENYPQYRGLIYDYVRLLIGTRQADLALEIINPQLITYPRDATLYQFQAQAYKLQNKDFDHHRAQAAAYAWQGKLTEAKQQLQLAKKSGESYYQNATIESDLKELAEIMGDPKKKDD